MPESYRITPALKRSPEHVAALAAVRGWTRAQFKLPEDGSVLVAEVACGLPGCPPLETVVAFWSEAGERHQFKIFKPVAEVVLDDLPPSWMKKALVVDEESAFSCC
jgi:nitrate reductase delta subunit